MTLNPAQREAVEARTHALLWRLSDVLKGSRIRRALPDHGDIMEEIESVRFGREPAPLRTDGHVQFRPTSKMSEAERLGHDGKWSPDNGELGFAFSCLDISSNPIAYYIDCWCDHRDQSCPRVRSSNRTLARFSVSNGRDAARESAAHAARLRLDFGNDRDRQCHMCEKVRDLDSFVQDVQSGATLIQGFTGRVFCADDCWGRYLKREGLA